ncbi:alpha-L-fucosidase [Pseudoxanthomonas sp. CF125]|uniref:alpha-L-fucosidase n=1 Tax=Pseudoxanthomonas sp. CF125 TaxID=1855303 RepID=UPI00088BC05A|nr:alpha-L-fucosidase [Pseudoxanthomonas sp. CF125]SDR16117.1 alpha-L-fucosidase [Pseudoxanthomonas sp. CF125]
MKAHFLLLALCFGVSSPVCVQAAEKGQAPEAIGKGVPTEERMQWFKDAKFGVFIHWGIYAVDGVGESWSFFNGDISYPDYMKQRSGFNAGKYDPDAWAALIKRSGARYAVLTSRHHDGVALWNSRQGINVVRDTPAGRDLVGPFVDALRKDGLKVGLYYSLPDWSYRDYDVFTRQEKRYQLKDDPARWQRFLDYYQGQLKEIADRYNPDLYWFDGDWEHSASEWQSAKVRERILAHNPNAIINSRLKDYGDYDTPEQGVPVLRPASKYWELCLTMNQSWGYQPRDNQYKNANQLIHVLADTIGMGGNLLLDIGPRADGSIDERQVQILEKMGRWTGKHAEAIYGSQAGIPLDHFHGPSTLSPDRKTLYLFLDGKPSGEVLVKGLDNQVLRARVVGSGAQVAHRVLGKHDWSKVPGLLYLDVPAEALDADMTVLALELDKPVALFQEEVKAIESN